MSVNGQEVDEEDDGAVALRELTRSRANGRIRGLAMGKNLLSARVVAQDGVTERTYTVTVTRGGG